MSRRSQIGSNGSEKNESIKEIGDSTTNDSLKEEPKTTDTKIDNNEFSMFRKVCFAIAGMSFQVHFAALSVFSSVFLLDRVKLPPQKNMFVDYLLFNFFFEFELKLFNFLNKRYILIVSRVFDAVTDPIYGYFIDKSKITRFGKMKPW